MCRGKQGNSLEMEPMEINDAFRTNPDASSMMEDFFNKSIHVYGDEHFPLSDKVDKKGWRYINKQ